MYEVCPICGKLHDDGAFVKVNNRCYFICMDCADTYNDTEIEEKIEANRKCEKICLVRISSTV